MIARGAVILDASALLAFLFREAGHEAVAELLSGSCLSTVNLAEVLDRFARDGHDPGTVLAQLESGPVDIIPFGPPEALHCAALVPVTARYGLSLGDRACLALARAREVPAVTADRRWGELDLPIEIRVIR